MALKNQKIASANPSAVANRAFIDALYIEKYGRKATDREFSSLSNRTVKDASNIVLGQADSPFAKTATTSAASQTQNTKTQKTSIPSGIKTSGMPSGTAVKTALDDVYNTFTRLMGRTPSSQTDWNNIYTLMKKAPTEVEKSLAASGKKQQTGGNTSNTVVDEGTRNARDYAKGLRDSGAITEVEYNAIVGSLDGIDVDKVPTEEELIKLSEDALTKARADLKDYYANVQKRDLQDLSTEFSDIRNEALRFQQQEAKKYSELLAETKQSLRTRGLTFAGTARKTLGAEAAIDSAGIEGDLPQQRRYDWEDKRAVWQQAARDLGLAAERRYGSDALYEKSSDINAGTLPDPYKGTLTYNAGRTQDTFLPNKQGTSGYVSRTEADIEREKEKEAQLRAADRMSTYK